jgi:hypothetical protein
VPVPMSYPNRPVLSIYHSLHRSRWDPMNRTAALHRPARR